ncbi:SURF1 family protein [Pseudomonas sp.]|uniref:SURF1 family protein n=1 Tax=Pseudomonas sp. TaxID=306 RepID=UPI003CC6918C
MYSSIARRFRPGWLPTLVVMALLPLLASLGVWQLNRAEEKRQLLALDAEHRLAEPIASAQLQGLQAPAFRRVLLRGQFDAEHSLMLDNRQRNGRVGIELLQPFHDQASDLWLLVNRGWLPWQDRRTPPHFNTPAQVVNLEAWVYVPPGATYQLSADPINQPWPRLVTAFDPSAMWGELGRDGYGHELRLTSGPGAYQLGWPVVALGPEQHIGYAVQWFAMTLTLAGLYLYFGFHNKKEKRHGSGHESTRPV